MRFYATFGVQYSHDSHPVLPPEFCNPNGVMEVIAPDMKRARAMVSAATDNAYAFLYPWPEPGSSEAAKMEFYYPAGVTCTLAVRPAESEASSGSMEDALERISEHLKMPLDQFTPSALAQVVYLLAKDARDRGEIA